MAKQTRTRIRELKAKFDAAHKKGMKGLSAGDYAALDNAVREESEILEEQSAVINEHLARAGAPARNDRRKRVKKSSA